MDDTQMSGLFIAPGNKYISMQDIHSAWFVVHACYCIHRNGLPLDQGLHAFLELAFFHVRHVHQVGVAGFAAVFVYQQFHQFPFPGELVLFADDFQEGDGVGEVEVAEVEALGGDLCVNAEVFEEALAGAAFDRGSQLFIPDPFSFLFFSFSLFPLFPLFFLANPPVCYPLYMEGYIPYLK